MADPVLYDDPSTVYDEKFAFGLKGLQAQLFFLSAHCLFYYFTLLPLAKIVNGYFANHKSAEQHKELNQKMLLSGYGIKVNKVAAGFTGSYIFTICLTQHNVGAILCLPAVCTHMGFPGLANFFGISPALAVFMAKQGAMCEAGWELSDVIFRSYNKWVLGDHVGQPDSLIKVFFLHHIMGLSMVVPMCAFDGGNPYFHEIVFLLQLAAGIGLVLQQLGFLLDTSNACDLLWMKAYVAITVVVMLYSRCFRFLWIFYSVATYYLFFENYNMLFGTFLAGLSMGLLNYMMVGDAIAKAKKYLTM